MKLTIKYSNQALKFFKKVDKDLYYRFNEAINDLSVEPFPHDSKRIEGSKLKLFRIRIGKYRLLYEVDYGNNLLGIVKIDKRDNIYN